MGHYSGVAKQVIFLFMEGGPSHLYLFDPKPLPNELHGETLPKSREPITAMGEQDRLARFAPRMEQQVKADCGYRIGFLILPNTSTTYR